MEKGTLWITSWYPKFNRSHFGLPPSSVFRMTGRMAISCELWSIRTGSINFEWNWCVLACSEKEIEVCLHSHHDRIPMSICTTSNVFLFDPVPSLHQQNWQISLVLRVWSFQLLSSSFCFFFPCAVTLIGGVVFLVFAATAYFIGPWASLLDPLPLFFSF